MSLGAPKLVNPKSIASEVMSLGAPLPPLLINIRAASYSIFLKPDESVFCFSNRFFPCWGWVGGVYGYWTYQRSMPPLRIVHWPSVLHLRKTAATSEEVIPTKYSLHCKNRVLQERPLQYAYIRSIWGWDASNQSWIIGIDEVLTRLVMNAFWS